MTKEGTVVFGCQYQGAPIERPPLIGFHRRGHPLQLSKAPGKIHRHMRNYVGSVTVGGDGKLAAASCPRGNMLIFWDIKSGQYRSRLKLPDGCGVSNPGGRGAGSPVPFLASSGTGKLVMARSEASDPTQIKADLAIMEQPRAGRLKEFQWDNHLTYLGPIVIPEF